MKKWLILSLFNFIYFLAFAQVERKVTTLNQVDTLLKNPDQTFNKMAERNKLRKELNLTKEQLVQMKEIRQSGKSRIAAIKNDKKLNADEKRIKLKEQKKEQFQRTMNILNDEQKQKMHNSKRDLTTIRSGSK